MSHFLFANSLSAQFAISPQKFRIYLTTALPRDLSQKSLAFFPQMGYHF